MLKGNAVSASGGAGVFQIIGLACEALPVETKKTKCVYELACVCTMLKRRHLLKLSCQISRDK